MAHHASDVGDTVGPVDVSVAEQAHGSTTELTWRGVEGGVEGRKVCVAGADGTGRGSWRW